ARVSHADRGFSRCTPSACPHLEPVSHTLRLELHFIENLLRPGVVLLHLLVSRIPEERPAFRYGVDRKIWMDPICRRRSGKSFRRCALRASVTPRLLADGRAQ